MAIIFRLLVLAASVAPVAFLPAHGAGSMPAAGLSSPDQGVGFAATRIAGRSMGRALRWLQRQRVVDRASRDGAAIEVSFKDGARLVILPAQPVDVPFRRDAFHDGLVSHYPARLHTSYYSPRAILLEPFASSLPRYRTQEAQEINILTNAGFGVDVLRNRRVTVKALENLPSYSVVYMETHSNIWGAGDVVIMTGETNDQNYLPLLRDGSIVQTTVAGQKKKVYYNALTTAFFAKHLDNFPNNSILFFNGCSLLKAAPFWTALQQRNVATLISWDEFALDSIAGPAGEYVLAHLWTGQTVAASIAAAKAVGLGKSVRGKKVAHLGFLGDGANTLLRALRGAAPVTPTPTSTATPSATPTPTPGTTPVTFAPPPTSTPRPAPPPPPSPPHG